MGFDKKINEWCKSSNSIAKDISKAFWVLDIILAMTLYYIVFILVIIGGI